MSQPPFGGWDETRHWGSPKTSAEQTAIAASEILTRSIRILPVRKGAPVHPPATAEPARALSLGAATGGGAPRASTHAGRGRGRPCARSPARLLRGRRSRRWPRLWTASVILARRRLARGLHGHRLMDQASPR